MGDYLVHYGVKRKSGRYPYGSGERPFQGEPKGLFAKRRKEKLKKKLVKNAEQKKQSQEEYEAARKKAIERGNATEIKQFSKTYTEEELQKAIRRINLERQLDEISRKEANDGWDKINNVMKRAKYVSDWSSTALILAKNADEIVKLLDKASKKKKPPENLMHSAKGSEWDEHKYLKKIDGTYYYPDSYEGGRHLSDYDEKEKNAIKSDEPKGKLDLSEDDITNLALEVIRGGFGNGEDRKALLGENYEEIQKKVNELFKGNNQKKVSEISEEEVAKGSDEIKKATSKASTFDFDKSYEVYEKMKKK